MIRKAVRYRALVFFVLLTYLFQSVAISSHILANALGVPWSTNSFGVVVIIATLMREFLSGVIIYITMRKFITNGSGFSLNTYSIAIFISAMAMAYFFSTVTAGINKAFFNFEPCGILREKIWLFFPCKAFTVDFVSLLFALTFITVLIWPIKLLGFFKHK